LSRLGWIIAVVVVAAGCGQSSSRPQADPGTSSSSSPSSSLSPVVSSTTTTVDAGTLPQTHVLPAADSAAFSSRMQGLWRAIVTGDPTPAMPSFFPLAAYEQVKAVANPSADWQNRLVAYYELDIQAAHQLLDGDAASAEFAGVSVPTARAVWVLPGQEYNKGAYYRLYGTRVSYRVGGRTRSFGIFSLISWRGEWYVVHLGPATRATRQGIVYRPA
jgi:hypothetical protein